MNKLLQIRIIDETTGNKYHLLGFRSQGDDRSGINVISVTLHDVDNRQVIIVDNPVKMKKYSVIVE
jgi:hypothetical protein